jgi:hypothetical protein
MLIYKDGLISIVEPEIKTTNIVQERVVSITYQNLKECGI